MKPYKPGEKIDLKSFAGYKRAVEAADSTLLKWMGAITTALGTSPHLNVTQKKGVYTAYSDYAALMVEFDNFAKQQEKEKEKLKE